MKDTHLKHVFWLSLATIFISTSGALGKFIAMPTPVIIWWRCALAVIFLLVFCKIKKVKLTINSNQDKLTFFMAALFCKV